MGTRRAFGLLVVASISATAAVVPTVASATAPTVYAMVIGITPYSLFSEAPSGTSGNAVTITLPVSESQPLFEQYNAIHNGTAFNKFPTVDIYVSTSGSGADYRLTDAFVISLSGGSFTNSTVTATLASATAVAPAFCAGTDAACAPVGLPRLSLASSTNPSDLALATTFTASRPRYPGGPAESGTVAFSADGTSITGCETVAISSGHATCTASFFVSGAHTITATDSGDTYYLQDSATLTQTVNTTGQFLVTVSGSQVAGSTTASFVADDTPPPGTTVTGSVACTGLIGGILIDSTLAAGAYIIDASTCSGLALSGNNASAYTVAYSSGAFTVTPVSITPVTVTITGSQDVGSPTPSFTPSSSPPSGITVTGTAACTGLTGSVPIGPGLGAGSYSIDPATCSGLSLAGTAASSYVLTYASGAFTVIDRTAPVVTLTSTPTDPSSDPLPGFAFSMTDPDNTSGLSAFCSFDGAPFAPCSSPAAPGSPLVSGLHTFVVHATDPSGNQSSDAGYIWNVGTAALSSITLEINGTNFAMLTAAFSGVPTDAVTMTTPGQTATNPLLFDLRNALLHGSGNAFFSATLTISGGGRIAHIHLSHALLTRLDIPSNPDHTLGTATLEIVFESWTASFTTDTTAPTVTLTSTPTNPTNNNQPTFGFTITDPDDTTGLQAVCSFDAAAFMPCTSPEASAGPLADGSHTFAVHATDPAGNQGPDASFTWLIDATPPLITATAVNADGSTYVSNTWTHQDVTVSFACTDPGGSGVATVSGPTTLHADGANQSVSGTCVDAAGNSSSTVFAGIDIDQTPPAVTVGHTVDGAHGWNIHAPVVVAITASDATSGIAGPPTCSDTFGGVLAVTGTATSYTAAINGDGVHLITCSVADLAGNTTHATDTVLLDVAGPSISVAHVADGNGGWNVHSPVALAISAADPISGLSGAPACSDSLNGGSSTSLIVGGAGPAFSAQAVGEGAHAVNCTATSVSGITRSASDAVRIDTVAPGVVYTGNAGTYTVDQSVTITCSATDPSPGSGVAQSTCAPISGPAFIFGLGSHTFTATATDNAGNVGHGSTTFLVTVTQQSLCNLTLSFVQGSARFKSLPANIQAWINQVAYGACLHLLKASQEPLDDDSDRDLTAYQILVNVLSAFGFLTASQGATLVNLSHALD
jgi:Big-like domain-containing protein